MRICLLLLSVLSVCGFAADPQPDLLDAAKKGRAKDVEALLAKGSDLEMKDKEGRTPLMLAAQDGRTAIVRADVRGTSEQSNLAAAEDIDGTLELTVEPGASCVQGIDRVTMVVRAELTRKSDGSAILEKVFGMGVKTGMKTEGASNPNQHAPLYAAWAKSQAGAVFLGGGGGQAVYQGKNFRNSAAVF